MTGLFLDLPHKPQGVIRHSRKKKRQKEKNDPRRNA